MYLNTLYVTCCFVIYHMFSAWNLALLLWRCVESCHNWWRQSVLSSSVWLKKDWCKDHCPTDTGTNICIHTYIYIYTVKGTVILRHNYLINQQTALFNNEHKPAHSKYEHTKSLSHWKLLTEIKFHITKIDKKCIRFWKSYFTFKYK